MASESNHPVIQPDASSITNDRSLATVSNQVTNGPCLVTVANQPVVKHDTLRFCYDTSLVTVANHPVVKPFRMSEPDDKTSVFLVQRPRTGFPRPI